MVLFVLQQMFFGFFNSLLILRWNVTWTCFCEIQSFRIMFDGCTAEGGLYDDDFVFVNGWPMKTVIVQWEALRDYGLDMKELS